MRQLEPRAIRVLILACLCCVMASVEASTSSDPKDASTKQSTVLILLDGFRWDLVSVSNTPNLARLAKGGVQGEMIPVWPTISSPNHWALATGLYPTHSGVLDNSMYDPATGRNFEWSRGTWGRGEPIWAAVSRQGGVSGVIGGWAGAQIHEGPNRPTFHVPYTAVVDERDNRAAVVLEMLDQDVMTRPVLLALYVIDVDHSEHEYGVGSAEAIRKLGQVDAMIGELLVGLEKRGLSPKVNVIALGDHGMANLVEGQTIYIDDLIGMGSLAVPPVGLGALMSLWPKKGQEEAIYQRLRRAHPHVHVMRGSEIPKRLNCCEPDRTPPLLVTADPGWAVLPRGFDQPLKAMHGYDNQVREMHSVFIAAGPAIRAGVAIKPFESVDVYALLAHLLKIEPVPTDGSILSLCPILVSPPVSCAPAPSGEHQSLLR